jgi:hypothetical protein
MTTYNFRDRLRKHRLEFLHPNPCLIVSCFEDFITSKERDLYVQIEANTEIALTLTFVYANESRLNDISNINGFVTSHQTRIENELSRRFKTNMTINPESGQSVITINYLPGFDPNYTAS